jgi:hypothetical protein
MFTNIYQASRILVIGGLVAFIGFFQPYVSLAEIGGIRIDREVKSNFNAYRFDSSYRYYYMGLENNPIAVMGLQKDYNFKDINWREVDPSSNTFKHVIELIRRFPEPNRPAVGAYILDGRKNIIGHYYSGAGVGVIVDNIAKSVFVSVSWDGSRGR